MNRLEKKAKKAKQEVERKENDAKGHHRKRRRRGEPTTIWLTKADRKKARKEKHAKARVK